MNHLDFADAFHRLTDYRPFPWQNELFNRFALGEFPSSCSIPTGLGKTAVVAVWLIALAHSSSKLPRRLVYVVNRRTVVDQTTNEVEKLRNLMTAGLSDALSQLCAIPLEKDQPPLAISTLRGQFADNREWSADPCRPAVIVGTVDMIGSRLLFSGYCTGFKTKPLHAGLLGQDVLLVHDEAHLEPSFQRLLNVSASQTSTSGRNIFLIQNLGDSCRGQMHAARATGSNQRDLDAPLFYRFGVSWRGIANGHRCPFRQDGTALQDHDSVLYSPWNVHAPILHPRDAKIKT